MSIAMQSVRSSSVRAVGYDTASKTLAIEFNSKDARMPGRIYHYANVPPEEHQALLSATSIGAHFARVIKARYPGKVIGKAHS